MRNITHFVAGAPFTLDQSAQASLFSPSTGAAIGEVLLGGTTEVDAAVSAALAAFPGWSRTGLQTRAGLMLELRDRLKDAYDEIVALVVEELGKTIADARAEVDRSLEILAQASSVGNWFGTTASPGVSSGVDTQEMRFPIGVVAGISPFNFPIMIPVLQSAMSIVCGNTFVMKPSERVPSCCARLAQLYKDAGFPDGVFNVVNGDRVVVEAFLEHPDIAGITFVGSTPVARHVRTVGVANGKRVQAFGGGKNHLIILPDADLDMAADAAVSAAYGAAGQRCMAVSVLVAVGDIADALVAKVAERIPGIKIGDPNDAASQLGPVITRESLGRIGHILDKSAGQGARIIVDGRQQQREGRGWFVGPTLIDHVEPGMDAHAIEIFGPVLSVVRAATYDDAMCILADHPLGNGAAIFTRDGGAARRFVDEVEAGQVGVNIPIPFPVFFHSFGGWKDSAFTETKLFGPGAIPFCTRSKTVSVRWPDPSTSKIDLGFPSSK
jgi:malonate-semialdehyde dehydrogenase (acetylating)/methylmalonate-semialdehyde dehydrogenase